jgi:hypothetical protein
VFEAPGEVMMRPAGVVEIPVRSESGRLTGTPELSWRIVAWGGLALVMVSVADFVLALVPLDFGNLEWEFGTVTVILNGMPAMAMGLALLLASAVARGSRLQMRTLAVVLFVLTALILAAITLYALTVPIGIRTTTNPIVLFGLKKAIARTVVQAVVYPLTYTAMGIAAIRYSARTP